MAFIPDDAVDRMTELSAGAWRLYCFLARCRNQRDGKCCPSLSLTMETIGTKKSQTYELRKELTDAGWAKFSGDTVTTLLGFDSPENRTPVIEAKAVGPTIPGFRKVLSGKLENSEKPESQSEIPETNSGKSDNFSEKPESFSGKPESHVRKNQQREPAKRTSKGKARPSAVPPSVAYVRHLTQRYPDKTLWPKIIKTLGEDFDEGRLTDCYENWVSHGWNKMNLVWLFEWYSKGIPEKENRNGRTQVTHKETHNERAFRESFELAATAFEAPSGFDSSDTADTAAAWPASDVGGL